MASGHFSNALFLSDYAWKLRYPGVPYTPEEKDVESMLSVAERVFREVQSRLPPETGISREH
jgi:hypothetical protein